MSDLSKALNGSNVLAIRTLINTSVFKQGILGATRCVDVHARVGGEEFAGLLAQTNETNAFEVLERFRKALENTRITLKDGTELSITVSIGYCDFFDGLHDVDHDSTWPTRRCTKPRPKGETG
ncbi:diguanylate cyclase [Halopseudomonas pachastrellae]|nr:diguanylate cyclase [Halopseudomonas pachastrellae]